MRVRTKRQLTLFIIEEGKRAGYSAKGLSLKTGYTSQYLTSSREQNSISLTAAINFLDVLGYDLVIRPVSKCEPYLQPSGRAI